jgi:hypothetical protein
MDIDVKGDHFGNHAGSLVRLPKRLKMNKYYLLLAYGLRENCDVYLLLGSTRNKAEIKTNTTGTKDFDSGNEFTIGFGTKMDFYKKGKWKVGGIYQMSWVRNIAIDKSIYINQEVPWYHTVQGELNMAEIQIAVGPTYQLNERVCIYGGPFFHLISGDFHYREHCSICGPINEENDDVREASWFGGYIGTQVNVCKNSSFFIEYLRTAMADALGMSFILRF